MPRNRTKDESGIATVLLIAIGGVILVAGAGAAFALTDGFGRNAEPTSAAAPTPTSSATVVGERPEDAATQDPVSSPMGAAFSDGKSVICSYTHEAYDATTILQSKDVYRIDQQTQGGPAHVIRGPERTYVWAAGMTEAMEFDIDVYEGLPTGKYPSFDPAEFDTADLFNDGTCEAVPAADEALFTLPADMTSAPA